MEPKFGPAGTCQAFTEAGNKTILQAPGWVARHGLTAYEYQCGRGVRLNPETGARLKAKGEEHGVTLSVHAPYYISLASQEEEKRANSVQYILDSARAVAMLGGDRIVVHPGGLNGRTREEATAMAKATLRAAQSALDEAGLSMVRICPETMGKINQLGSLEEVLDMCEVDERFLPCVDFGHLNSRTLGQVNSYEAFAGIVDAVRNRLGEERSRCFHAHFSKIAYTQGGEKAHLTFADDLFGPEPGPLMELVARRGLYPTFICESAGTQTQDAVALHRLWEAERDALGSR